MLLTVSQCTVSSALFFFNDTATTEIYTLSLHDALPIYTDFSLLTQAPSSVQGQAGQEPFYPLAFLLLILLRSEEHTSELQSRQYLVCRLLLEKKKRI